MKGGFKSAVADGEVLSRAWMGVFAFTGDNPDIAMLDDTIVCEIHEEGMRMICSDGVMVAKTWVPFGRNGSGEPPIEELPEDEFVVSDMSGRGGALMSHVARVTKGENGDVVDLKLSKERIPQKHPALTPEMESIALVIELANSERVTLPIIASGWQGWRRSFMTDEGEVEDDGRRYLWLPASQQKRLSACCGALKATGVEMKMTPVRVRFSVESEIEDVPEITGVFALNRNSPTPTTAEEEEKTDDADAF